MNSNFVSLPEAARRLGYSRATIYRLISQGRLQVYRAAPKSHPRTKLADPDALMKNEQTLNPKPSLDDLFAAADAHFGLSSRTNKRLH